MKRRAFGTRADGGILREDGFREDVRGDDERAGGKHAAQELTPADIFN